MLCSKVAHTVTSPPPSANGYFPKNTSPRTGPVSTTCCCPPPPSFTDSGEKLYWGRNGGTTYFQDAFGRTAPENTYLKKTSSQEKASSQRTLWLRQREKVQALLPAQEHNQRPSWTFKSIRERNLFLCNAVEKILGLNKDKTWDDVRRELTPDQVAEIHRVYAFLWPRDTDIYSLLPKPDGQCRALYTGMIDPTTIPGFALGSAPLFDEILIQQPFVNPAEVKPDFSPVHSPHLYRQHTLKNVFLLFVLMPYIDAGFVNFFPDPCVFDEHLLKQMMQMAEARSGDVQLDAAEEGILMGMARDDFHRAHSVHTPRIAKKNGSHPRCKPWAKRLKASTKPFSRQYSI